MGCMEWHGMARCMVRYGTVPHASSPLGFCCLLVVLILSHTWVRQSIIFYRTRPQQRFFVSLLPTVPPSLFDAAAVVVWW